MQDSFLSHVDISRDNLADDFFGFGFFNYFLMSQQGSQVSMGAVLSDDVVEILGFIGVIKFDKVWMTDDSMNFDLIL